uniref:Putative transposase-like protein HI-13281 (Trinotate prediction) n=1 Tax=Henneguya salminicola TaxID=69463 RepID=A0A6G3MIQ3_HENSL
MFFVCVPDRSTKTLLPIIKNYIKPGTIIHSDCWKSYECLSDHGYVHQTVNHSKEFVSIEGIHTNNIESRWHALKLSLPRTGTQKQMYDGYFAEYIFRRKYMQNYQTLFQDFIKQIARIY